MTFAIARNMAVLQKPPLKPDLRLVFAGRKTADSRVSGFGGNKGTYIDSAGVMQALAANAIRLDHHPVTLAPLGVLIEKEAENICLQSADLATTWLFTNASANVNQVAAPDGATAMDKMEEDGTAGAAHRVFQNFTGTAANYCASIFVKSDERALCAMEIWNGTTAKYVHVDLSDGTTFQADTGAGVIDYGGGIYRLYVPHLMVADACSISLYMMTTKSAYAFTYDGTLGEGLYAWGGQIELGLFPTSHIPTAAAAVTRTADALVISGSDFSQWFASAAEGMIYIKGDQPLLAAGGRMLEFNDGTTNEAYRFNTESDNGLDAAVDDGGVAQASMSIGAVAAATPFKAALGFKAADFAACKDGGAISTDTAGTLPTVDRADLGKQQSALHWNGHIAEIEFHRRKPPNGTLQWRTT